MIKAGFAFMFSYKGRASRKDYLIIHAVAIPLLLALTYPSLSLNSLAIRQWVAMIIIYCTIPISIKRCHDIGWNTWAYLGFVWFIPMFSRAFSFHTNVLITAIVIRIIGSIWLLVACVYLCIRRGTHTANRDGEIPS